MPKNNLSPRRRRWKRAAKVGVNVTMIALAVVFGLRFFSAHAKGAKAAEIRPLATPASDAEVDALRQKIEAEHQAHQRLELKSAQLAASAQQASVPEMSPEQRVRVALTRKLVRLLALEKQYPEGSPEIAETREQIDNLQAERAEMPATHTIFRARVNPVRPIELAETENKLSLNEVGAKADARRLADLLRAKEIADARRPEWVARTIPGLVVMSVLLGFLSASSVLLWHVYRAVRSEAALRSMLPRGIELVGAVPHMRTR